MGDDNVELLWYGLCVIKAVVTLFVVSVSVLLCKRFLRCISAVVLSGVRRYIRRCIPLAPCNQLGKLTGVERQNGGSK